MPFTPPQETVGERVRWQRKQLGPEQCQLAERSGIWPATDARIEGGAEPRLDALDRLAKALKTPASWLRDDH